MTQDEEEYANSNGVEYHPLAPEEKGDPEASALADWCCSRRQSPHLQCVEEAVAKDWVESMIAHTRVQALRLPPVRLQEFLEKQSRGQHLKRSFWIWVTRFGDKEICFFFLCGIIPNIVALSPDSWKPEDCRATMITRIVMSLLCIYSGAVFLFSLIVFKWRGLLGSGNHIHPLQWLVIFGLGACLWALSPISAVTALMGVKDISTTGPLHYFQWIDSCDGYFSVQESYYAGSSVIGAYGMECCQLFFVLICMDPFQERSPWCLAFQLFLTLLLCGWLPIACYNLNLANDEENYEADMPVLVWYYLEKATVCFACIAETYNYRRRSYRLFRTERLIFFLCAIAIFEKTFAGFFSNPLSPETGNLNCIDLYVGQFIFIIVWTFVLLPVGADSEDDESKIPIMRASNETNLTLKAPKAPIRIAALASFRIRAATPPVERASLVQMNESERASAGLLDADVQAARSSLSGTGANVGGFEDTNGHKPPLFVVEDTIYCFNLAYASYYDFIAGDQNMSSTLSSRSHVLFLLDPESETTRVFKYPELPAETPSAFGRVNVTLLEKIHPDLQLHTILVNYYTDTVCHVSTMESPDGALVSVFVSFRGTNSYRQMTTDLNTYQIDCNRTVGGLTHFPTDAAVHQGFWDAYNSVRDELSALLDELSPVAGGSRDRRLPRISFVGHSLGGTCLSAKPS